MYAIMHCQIHKKTFEAGVGFGPITRDIPHENPRINELDMQHPNAPKGYSAIRYCVFGGCNARNGCNMADWKFMKEITEAEYFKNHNA